MASLSIGSPSEEGQSPVSLPNDSDDPSEDSAGDRGASVVVTINEDDIEDSQEGSQEGSLEDDPSSDGDYEVFEEQGGHDEHQDQDSVNALDLDVADGISNSSFPIDIDLEEVFLRAAYDDSSVLEWDSGDARTQTMPQTRQQSVARMAAANAAAGPPSPSPQHPTSTASPSAPAATLSRPESGRTPPTTSQGPGSQRSANKRSHSEGPEARPESSAAGGAAHDRLPPISYILDSIGGGGGGSSSSSSGGSQPSWPRQRTSPKRLKREDPIVIDDLFGSDDDNGVEIVDLVDVDRPKPKQEPGEETAEARAEAEAEAGADAKAEPEPAPVPEPPSESLVKFSGLQCVICMDDMTSLTVTHCGHLFCGECLHSSLIMSRDRKICPICRTKLEMRVHGMPQTKMARSYFPLVVKLRSANKQGKQPMRPA